MRASDATPFAFEHELLRQALLDEIGEAATARLQQIAADVLEAALTRRRPRARRRPPPFGGSAGAGVGRAGGRHGASGGGALAAPFGPESAAPLLRGACSVYEQLGQAAPADLLNELGRAEYARGRLEVARGVFRLAVEGAEDPIAFVDAVLGLGSLTVFEHRSAAAADRFGELLDDAMARVPPDRRDLQARLRVRRSVECWLTGRGPLSDVIAGAPLVADIGDAGAAVDAISAIVHTVLGPHHAELRLALVDTLVAQAGASNDAFFSPLFSAMSGAPSI